MPSAKSRSGVSTGSTRLASKNYGAAVEALEPVGLADQFEQAATDGIPIRTLVGEDPAEFAEALLSKYPDDEGISVDRDRLIQAIDRAPGEDAGDHESAR